MPPTHLICPVSTTHTDLCYPLFWPPSPLFPFDSPSTPNFPFTSHFLTHHITFKTHHITFNTFAPLPNLS